MAASPVGMKRFYGLLAAVAVVGIGLLGYQLSRPATVSIPANVQIDVKDTANFHGYVKGDPNAPVTAMLTDMREGKMTYPLILAMERDASLAPILEEAMAADESGIDPLACEKVARAVAAARAGEDSLELATKFCREAVKSLEVLPQGRARSSLEAVAMSTPGTKATNSSPPIRLNTSVLRKTLRQRSAIARSTRSPVACP